jgi:hypothetical protein
MVDPRHEQRPERLGQPWDVDGLFVAAVVCFLLTVAVTIAWGIAEPVKPVATDPIDVVGTVTTVEVPAVDTTSTSTTAAPIVLPSSAPRSTSGIWFVQSSMYCYGTVTKSGTHVRPGVVGVSFADFPRLKGTTWQVLDGPAAGRIVTVEDAGPAAHFDIYTPDCYAAKNYGPPLIHVQQITPSR